MNVQYPKYPKYNKSVQMMYPVHSSKSSQQHKLYYIPKHNSSPYSQRIQSFFGGQMYIPYIHSQIPSGIIQNQLKKAGAI